MHKVSGSDTQEPFSKDPKQISEIKQGITNKRVVKWTHWFPSDRCVGGGARDLLNELNMSTFMAANFLLRPVVYPIYQDCVLPQEVLLGDRELINMVQN